MNSAKAVLATFNPAPTYAIGLVANPAIGGSVSCSVNPVIQGGSTNCTATPNAGLLDLVAIATALIAA